MDQISRLYFDIIGRDKGGSKALNDAASASDRAHLGFSKLSGTLSGLGGPFDQVTMFAGNLGSALDETLSKSQKLGLGLTAIGVGLTAFGAKDQQAQKQLQQAIENTGASEADYRDQINATIKAQERNAHTMDDTENALNTLVTATQDVARSLSEMNLVANIAAQKHESLAEAATQLVQAQAGNTRAFKSFGIVLDTTLPKSEAIDKALKQLQDRLSGQASASVNTFTGHLKVWGVELEDDIARLSKFGPAATILGAALTAVSTGTQILIARRLADTAAAVRQAAANTALAASYDAVAASAGAAGVAQDAAAAGGVIGAGMAGRIPGALGIAGRLAIPAAIAYGTYQTYKYQVSKDSRGFTGEQENKLKFLEGEAPSQGRADVAKFYHVYTALKDYDRQKAADKAASDAAEKANQQYTTSLVKQQQAAVAAKNSLGAHLTALENSVGKALSLSSAEDDLQSSMHNMAQAAHDGGKALHGHSLAAEANRNALRDSVSKYLAFIQAEKDAGVHGEKLRQVAIQASKALEHQASEIFGNKQAVDQLLGSLKVLPGQIQRSFAASLDGVFANMDDQFHRLGANFFSLGGEAGASWVDGFNTTLSNGRPLGQYGQGGDPGHVGFQLKGAAKKSAHDYGNQVASTVISGYAPAVDSGVSSATQKAMDKAKQKVQAEAQYMHTVLSQITGAYQNTKQSLIDQASLANRQQGTDLLGATGPAQSALAFKRQFAHQMIHFARLIDKLADKYDPVIVDEVEGLGTVAGIQAAQELLSYGRKKRRELEHAEHQIERASRRISATVTSGDYSPEILKAIQKLPDQFDRKFEHTLRRLHIITDTGKQDRKQGHHVRAH